MLDSARGSTASLVFHIPEGSGSDFHRDEGDRPHVTASSGTVPHVEVRGPPHHALSRGTKLNNLMDTT